MAHIKDFNEPGSRKAALMIQACLPVQRRRHHEQVERLAVNSHIVAQNSELRCTCICDCKDSSGDAEPIAKTHQCAAAAAQLCTPVDYAGISNDGSATKACIASGLTSLDSLQRNVTCRRDLKAGA